MTSTDHKVAETRLAGTALIEKPHVVMIVANDVTIDTRVRKMAHDLAAAGPRVTVLGVSPSGQRGETLLGKASLIRLVLNSPARLPRRGSLFTNRSSHYLLKQRIRTERDRYFSHQREVGAQIGWLRKDYFADRRVRREIAKASEIERRERLHRRNERVGALIGSVKHRPIPMMRGLVERSLRLIIKADRFIGRSLDYLRRRRLQTGGSHRDSRLHRTERRMRRKLSSDYSNHLKRLEKLQAKLLEAAGPKDSPSRLRVDWRNELPELHDYDNTFGPEIDALAPDIIHVHDVHLLGVAARAIGRLYVAGRDTRLIYDAHEYVQGLSRYSKRVLAAWSGLEREYIRHTDRIITVSPPLARLLQEDYDLPHLPDVVMNIPPAGSGGTASVREAAGVDAAVPLVVYSGGLDPTRGVHTLVEAIGRLEGVHVALVSKATTDYVHELMEIGVEGGFANRLHVVPFVEPQTVVTYLRSATTAVHPMVAGPMNHEIALPNKIFEYMHARLPIVVSNCRAMSDLVTEHEIGEVFESGKVESLTRTLNHVLGNLDKYQAAYDRQPDLFDRYSWNAQRNKVLDLYQGLLGEEHVIVDPVIRELPPDTPARSSGVMLAIGPLNMAGQAWEWAQAAERNLAQVRTEAFEIVRPNKIQFRAHRKIPAAAWRSLDWQLEWARHIASDVTHVILESGSGILGNLNGGRLPDDLGFLRERGIEVAVALHGSEVRDPLRHRDLVPASPFRPGEPMTDRLTSNAAATLAMIEAFDGPVFVSTLDLLDYVPDASWLPQVVSLDRWQPHPFESRYGPIRVLFPPTDAILKGSRFVEDIGGRLDDEGIIDLRVISGVATSEMPGLIAECDVLIDSLVLGLYGITSVEGMASGRIVLANLCRVLDRQTEAPPITHTTPETLEQTLRDIAARPEVYRELAIGGPAYVRTYHDGRFVAHALTEFLAR